MECDGLNTLAHALTGDDAFTTKHALLTLKFIGADNKLLERKIEEAGVIPLVVELSFSASNEIKMEAFEVIDMLCRGGESLRAMLAANGMGLLVKSRALKCLRRK